MTDPQQQLRDLEKHNDFFIGIDSDGCVFDSMEIKHKECFCPAFVNHFGMQPVSKYAREAWEFVNLYSQTRGCNRFFAVGYTLDLLAERKEVQDRDVEIPAMKELRAWVKRESKLGNPALKAELEMDPNPDLETAMAWSLDVNAAVGKIVRNVPPFPRVVEALKKMQGKADPIVVSQTPEEALVREWKEHAIDSYVKLIAGQEMGTKTEHIALAAKGKYDDDKILMVGDAPGDLQAAKSNEALYYPINPGHEEESWERFVDEALGRFFAGTYAGEYEQQLIEQFNSYLPSKAPWQE